jgi:hypothetical protein
MSSAFGATSSMSYGSDRQSNARDAGDVRSLGLIAGQMHFWF